MRLHLLLLLAAGTVAGQPAPTELDTTDARSNAYVHENWSYFAERLRNEFLALGEKKYRRGEYQAAVMEYFNFLYHFPEDELLPLVHYRIGRAYEQLAEFELAREQFNWVQEAPRADARVKVVSLRQLARMDYEAGHYDTVLALPPLNDPYLMVLKGYAALTVEHWTESAAYLEGARRYYPRRAQARLDSLLADIRALPRLPYYRPRWRTFWNLLPGGGMHYLDMRGEALGYAVSIVSLGLATAAISQPTRYVVGAVAAGLYGASFPAAARAMEGKNRVILALRLEELHAAYPLSAFWSFAHPAIY